ncbi:MAG TPA: hypothetical protein VGY56_17755 [Verrucomicrobiae bacterium]|nr:hypothetical protein [Verrucomicrobiae bacterium]
MEYSYSHRHYLLPKGCKDLIDAVKVPMNIDCDVTWQLDGIIVRYKLAELRRADADIIIRGRYVQIVEKSPERTRRQNAFYVPGGYDLARALTTYTEDEVRIFVPKC